MELATDERSNDDDGEAAEAEETKARGEVEPGKVKKVLKCFMIVLSEYLHNMLYGWKC